MHSRIVGTGSYLPEKIMTNHDLELLVETSDQWITERTGIKTRHIAAQGENTCDLAMVAARRALESAEKSTDEIDLIIVATTTADKIFPSTACLLQQRLDIHGCAAFDVQAVCTGFVYALGVADSFIRSGNARCALVVGAETVSRIIDWTDRDTCVLFGDGIRSFHLHADGHYEHLLHVPQGISQGYDKTTVGEAYLQMKGNEVFRMAVRTLGRIIDETLAANNIDKSDIDWIVPHQANYRILEATAKKLKMSMDQVVVTVDKHGNTSAASIPLALDVAVRDGRIRRGETIIMEAFGGGFTWGSALLDF